MIYLAGPITQPDPMANANAACKIATAMVDAGLTPYVPQTSVIWQTITPRPWDWWLAYDFRILEQCELLIRIPGVSKGADAEVCEAKRRGIPVVFMRTIHPNEAVALAEEALDWISRNPGEFFAASSGLINGRFGIENIIFGSH